MPAAQPPDVPPQPGPATPPNPQTDPRLLNDEAFLAAEAIRLGIRVGDDAPSSALAADEQVLAQAREMGLRVGDEANSDWEVPFDDEMERTAILLGIRSENSLGKQASPPREVSRALPWLVILIALLAGVGATTLLIDPLVAFFKN